MATNYDFFYSVPYPLGIVKYFHCLSTPLSTPLSIPQFDLNEYGAGCNSTEETLLPKNFRWQTNFPLQNRLIYQKNDNVYTNCQISRIRFHDVRKKSSTFQGP